MKERQVEDLLKAYARQVIASSERATAATRQLLTSKRMQIRTPDHISLNGIVRETEDVMRLLLGNTVRLEIVLADTEPVVWGDKSLLQQLLTNLAAHAKETMDDGSTVTVTVKTLFVTNRLHREEQWNRHCVGVSFAYRASEAVAGRSGAGDPFTPLGVDNACLSAAYAIVKQHHGSINVTEPGEDRTVLSIYLPAVAGQAEQSTKWTASAVIADEQASAGEGNWPSRLGGSASSR